MVYSITTARGYTVPKVYSRDTGRKDKRNVKENS
nr:MAG TPA: hypothetical protein [Caudoviricetes sp.]